MIKLKPGDSVICHLKENAIINPYDSNYDESKTFDIIASDSYGYYLFVPPYTFLKGIIKIDLSFIKKMELDKKYLNDSVIHITENLIYKIKSQTDGCFCTGCKDFYYQSASNQEDGSFICWSCRNNKYR